MSVMASMLLTEHGKMENQIDQKYTHPEPAHTPAHEKFPARRQVENQTVQRPVAVKINQLRIVDGALFPGSLRPGDTEPAAKSAAGWHGTLSDGLDTCTTARVRKF